MPASTGLPHRRIPELDGLRAVAILLVIAYHYLQPLQTTTGWRFYALAPARGGWIGVDLFFVLSGYLLGSILLANRESPAFFSTFYLRRFCRILPLYVPVVAVLHYAHERLNGSPQAPLLQYLTFTHNFWIAAAGKFGNDLLAVTWSLAVEEQFYVLLPLLVRFNRPRRLMAIAIVSISLAVVLRYALLVTSGPAAYLATVVLLPTRLDSLMLGVLAACLHARGITVPRPALWVVWAASGSWIVNAVLHRPGPEPASSLLMGALSPVVIALFCLSTLLIALSGGFRLLRWRVLGYTGLISYGLYLLHQPVQILVGRLLPALGAWVPIVALGVTFLAATFSWELLEKRFVRYGHRFLYDPRQSEPLDLSAGSGGQRS